MDRSRVFPSGTLRLNGPRLLCRQCPEAEHSWRSKPMRGLGARVINARRFQERWPRSVEWEDAGSCLDAEGGGAHRARLPIRLPPGLIAFAKFVARHPFDQRGPIGMMSNVERAPDQRRAFWVGYIDDDDGITGRDTAYFVVDDASVLRCAGDHESAQRRCSTGSANIGGLIARVRVGQRKTWFFRQGGKGIPARLWKILSVVYRQQLR